MVGPLLFATLVALGLMITFAALWRLTGIGDPVDARLKQYGHDTRRKDIQELDDTERDQRPSLWRQLLNGFGAGPQLATTLAQADLPLTAAEFALIMLALAVFGFILGTLRLSWALGLLIGLALGCAPLVFVRGRQRQRQRLLTQQLPDTLTLLVGALRAGYGLSQATEMLVPQIPAPMATELSRVSRSTRLGLSIQQALNEMAERVGTDDIDLVVAAINVQYEMGGNVAQTLEIIAETVRDRIRIQRDIQVYTSQQRLTGYILALLPIALATVLFILSPEHMSRLFEPGWVRLLPIGAVIMQLVGFLVIRRIVAIEV